jgi:uncharacterized protein DUF3455
MEVEMRNVRFVDSAVTTLFVLGAFAVSLPQAANADEVTPPPVPADIQVPAGNKAFLVGHAFGTQNYICLRSATRFAWTLFTPQATLLGDDDEQVITHFFSPNPSEDGTIRATWQHSQDTSTVWARVVHSPSSDPNFVEAGAVPWVLLQRAGVKEGPTGGDTLTATTFVQRLNTHGGVAPSTGCSSAEDVGDKAFMPYTADYFFYRADDGN